MIITSLKNALYADESSMRRSSDPTRILRGRFQHIHVPHTSIWLILRLAREVLIVLPVLFHVFLCPLRLLLLLLPDLPRALLAPQLGRRKDAVQYWNHNLHGESPLVPQRSVKAKDGGCFGDGADERTPEGNAERAQ